MSLEKFMIFQINNEEYALRVEDIVTIEIPLTTFQKKNEGVPSYLLGVEKISNEKTIIFDLHHVFYEKHVSINDLSRLIIVRFENFKVAFLVDDIVGIMEFQRQSHTYYDLIKNSKNSFFTGALEKDSSLVLILDAQKLINVVGQADEIEKLLKESEEESVEKSDVTI